MRNYRHHFILMSALGVALSAGAAAVAAIEHAGEALLDDIKSAFGLRHAVTGQVNEFDTPEAADHFLASVPDEDRTHWQAGAAGASPAAKHVTVDLTQLRADIAADAAGGAAPASTDTPAADAAAAA